MYNAVKQIDINKSSGIKTMSTKVLKDSLELLCPQVTKLIRHCLRHSTYPVEWKVANVIPISKPGPPSDIGNWRPISLLNGVSKLVETIIHDKIQDWLEDNNVISPHQFGFRKHRGTQEAIFTYLNTLYAARAKKQIALSCYVDVSKAFDAVYRPELIQRVKATGLPNV